MPKTGNILLFVILSYVLFLLAIIFWAASLLKIGTSWLEYFAFAAAGVLTLIATSKGATALKSVFTKDQIKVIMVAFNAFISTIIILVAAFVIIRYL